VPTPTPAPAAMRAPTPIVTPARHDHAVGATGQLQRNPSPLRSSVASPSHHRTTPSMVTTPLAVPAALMDVPAAVAADKKKRTREAKLTATIDGIAATSTATQHKESPVTKHQRAGKSPQNKSSSGIGNINA
jgi:hypothetical protein